MVITRPLEFTLQRFVIRFGRIMTPFIYYHASYLFDFVQGDFFSSTVHGHMGKEVLIICKIKHVYIYK